MIRLTRDDWCEIYYALETKSRALRNGQYPPEDESGQDAEWIAHLEMIREKIGADGTNAADEGIARSG